MFGSCSCCEPVGVSIWLHRLLQFAAVHAQDAGATSHVEDDFIFEYVLVVDNSISVGASAYFIFLSCFVRSKGKANCNSAYQHFLMDTLQGKVSGIHGLHCLETNHDDHSYGMLSVKSSQKFLHVLTW